MFLMGVGDQVSAELLRQLDPDEIKRITDEISALNAVPPDHMLSVFSEFENLAADSRYFAKGGVGWARRLLEQALGPESAQRLLNAPATLGRERLYGARTAAKWRSAATGCISVE